MTDQTTHQRALTAPPAPENGYRRWTEADDHRLKSMIAAGEPAAVVGASLGRSEGAVRQRLRRLGAAETAPEPTLSPWLFVVGGGFVWFIHATSPEARMKRFARAVAKGEFDRADRIAARVFRMHGP